MMRSSYNHRRNIKETDIMLDNQALNHLIHFLKAGISPYHTVSHAADTLDAAGFQALDFKAPWALEKGKSYYCRTFSGELFAFRIGTHAVLEKRRPHRRRTCGLAVPAHQTGADIFQTGLPAGQCRSLWRPDLKHIFRPSAVHCRQDHPAQPGYSSS